MVGLMRGMLIQLSPCCQSSHQKSIPSASLAPRTISNQLVTNYIVSNGWEGVHFIILYIKAYLFIRGDKWHILLCLYICMHITNLKKRHNVRLNLLMDQCPWPLPSLHTGPPMVGFLCECTTVLVISFKSKHINHCMCYLMQDDSSQYF